MVKKKIDEAILQQMIAGKIPLKDEPVPAQMDTSEPKNKENYTRFLERRFIENRRSVYISQNNYDEIFKIVRLLGNKINVSCIVNNILTYHIIEHRDSLNDLRASLLEQLKL